MRIDCDTEMTGYPVWRETRSAVRWRIPVSRDSIVGSGRSWTLARRIRRAAKSTTTAPSILASSRRRAAVNSTSSSNPPEQSASTPSS